MTTEVTLTSIIIGRPGIYLSGGGGASPALASRDDYAVALAAGAVDGTLSDPFGNLTRQVDDSESKLTIATDKLTFAGGKASPVWTDPRLWYEDAIVRVAGRALKLTGLTIAANQDMAVGLFSSVPPTSANRVVAAIRQTTSLTVGSLTATFAAATAYDVYLLLRVSGFLAFIKGGAYTQWTLFSPTPDGTTTPLYLGYTNRNAVSSLDAWSIEDIPNFSESTYAYFYDTAPVTGDMAIGASNGFAEMVWTPAAAEIFELNIRRLDDDNRTYVRCDQAASTIQIGVVNAGVTTLGTLVSRTWTVGTPYRVTMMSAEGTTLRALVDGTQRTFLVVAANTHRGVKVSGFATGSNLVTFGYGVYGTGSAPAAPVAETFTMLQPMAYQTFQRNGSDQADIRVSAILPTTAATLVEARWRGGSWTSLGTVTGGWIDTVLPAQAAGQGTFELRCDGGTPLTAAYVGIGDVIIVAGQSNAEGYGTNNQSYTHATLKATQVLNGVWADGNDPFGEVAGPRGSVWPSAATAIMASTGYPVAFIDRAISGVSITTYLPAANHFDTTTNYGNLADAAKRYGATLVVWWQGETDAYNAMAEATYNGHLDTIANAINTDTGLKLMACLWQHITTTADANQDAIRTAISTAWADNANVLEGPTLSDMEQDDGWHLKTNAKLTEAGQRWAVKILPQL